jgi:tetratricopeptide (TPR) repeat protein
MEESNNKLDTRNAIGLKTILSDILIDKGLPQCCEAYIENTICNMQGDSWIENPAFFEVAQRLALAKRRSGKLDEAEIIQTTLLENRIKTFGKVSFHVANSLEGLMSIMIQKGKHNDAETVGLRALDIRRKLSAQSSKVLYDIMSNLASVKSAIGKTPESEKLLEEVLSNQEKEVNHSFVLSQTLLNLAIIKKILNKHLEARELLERAISLERTIWGEEIGPTNIPLGNDKQCCQGEDYCAHGVILTPRHIYRIEKNPRRILEILRHRIETEQSLRNFANAERLQREVLNGRESAGWTECNHYILDMLELNKIYRKLGKYIESEALNQRAIVEAKRIFGEHHKYVWSAMNELSVTKFVRSQLVEAETINEQIIRGNQQPTVRDTAHYVTALSNQTYIKIKTGKWKQCINLVLELSHVGRISGENNPLKLDYSLLKTGEKVFVDLCLQECLKSY